MRSRRAVVSWEQRLRTDEERARVVQDKHLQALTQTVLERCVEAGAQTVILIGSTARGCRTAHSDIDYYVVGSRPEIHDLAPEIELSASSPEKLWRKLREGDDFVQWALRFGLILADSEIAKSALAAISAEQLWPDPERKAMQAERMLRIAQILAETGDTDAAHEQTATALGLTARWKLLASGVFPLSVPELADQLDAVKESGLAAVHRNCLEAGSSAENLRAWMDVAQRLLGARDRSPAQQRRAA